MNTIFIEHPPRSPRIRCARREKNSGQTREKKSYSNKIQLLNLSRIFHTIKYLKTTQVYHQIKYRFQKPGSLQQYRPEHSPLQPIPLHFFSLPDSQSPLKIGENGFSFTFLNRSLEFGESITWNEQRHGKLWNYNLQYLDFLRQPDIEPALKQSLISDIYSWLESGDLPLEPYPASLRIMNVIRFFSEEQPSNTELLYPQVHAEAAFLSTRLEYHLLGNHLLENGFALLMAGTFFQERSWSEIAEKLIRSELNEQILSDGAHFELSPMYHRIILFRLLEVIGYLKKDTPFYDFLQQKAELMHGWMRQMTFADGSMPHFNDSTDGIAFTPGQLSAMAKSLGVNGKKPVPLESSGYRRRDVGPLTGIFDIAGIAPKYQPGHAHADSLSFVLYRNGKPWIVDTGISTYAIGPRREYERSTLAHNTVTVDDVNTAGVWSGFRVGKRPKVKLLSDSQEQLELSLSYKSFQHRRNWAFSGKQILLEDKIKVREQGTQRFHLHPDIDIVEESADSLHFSNGGSISWNGIQSIQKESYDYCSGYHKYVKALCLRIDFMSVCQVEIQ